MRASAASPAFQRTSTRRFWPSVRPNCCKAWGNAATYDCGAASVAAPFISTPTRRTGPDCCARAASGHAAAAPPSSVMNLRRLMDSPSSAYGRTLPHPLCEKAAVHSSKIDHSMAEMGHDRTFGHVGSMSGLPTKADIDQRSVNVRLVPIATQRSAANLEASPSECAALPDRTASIAARPYAPLHAYFL